MNVNVSPQMRIVALAGLLAVLGLMVVVFTLSRHSAAKSSEPTPGLVPHQPVRPQVHVKPAPAPVKPAERPTVPRHRVNPVVTAALAAGWPKVVAKPLADSKVVLVELYSSEAPLDVAALAEVRGGARQAGVPVVALDVSRKADSSTRTILKKLGTLNSPTALFVQRPGTLFVRLEGFQDQSSVAQAAANAAFPRP